MSYYLLEPDVAGELGENTVMDTSLHPPRIEHLHYAIDDWTGDELLESTPAFIITRRLADTLTDAELTGYRMADAEVTLSETGVDIMGDVALPDFCWLQITGTPGQDDFGLTQTADLIASETALQALRQGNLNNCETQPWTETD